MSDESRPSKLNPREELVALLRGHAACPILSGLGEHGLLDRMVSGPFAATDFPNVTEPRLLGITLTYLVSLGLLRRIDGDPPRYEVTKVGRTVFTRYGSCALIHSYRDYFERLPGLIVGKDRGEKPAVDRRVNVLGSGQLHARKFFPDAYRILAAHPFRRLIDVGCGNGEFLAGLRRHRPDVQAAGVDVSAVAVAEAQRRFGDRVPCVPADGFNVAEWVEQLPAGPEPVVISLWYVLHEFTRDNVRLAKRFFRELQAFFPSADVILGEIVNLPPDVLAAGHVESIMPEFLLFHALSGQGVFTWKQHAELLEQIPYTLACEVLFDELPDGSGGTIPSSFIWHLRPQ